MSKEDKEFLQEFLRLQCEAFAIDPANDPTDKCETCAYFHDCEFDAPCEFYKRKEVTK